MTNTGLINSFNEVNSFLIFLRNEYATAAEAGNLSSGDLTAAVQLNAQASADAEDAAKDLLEREFEKIQEEVNIDKEILGALPKNGIRANSKYAQRVEEVAAKYYVYKDKLYDEAKRRYNELYTAKYNTSVNVTDGLDELEEKIYLLNEYNTAFEKIGLDKDILVLRYYYKKDLGIVNNAVADAIAKFRSVGLQVTPTDFKYNKYVTEYMTVFLDKLDKDDLNSAEIKTKFEEIYWKCPEIITYIELNLQYIYNQNEKRIEKALEDKKAVLLKQYPKDEVWSKYTQYKTMAMESAANDAQKIVGEFRDRTLRPADFTSENISKLVAEYTGQAKITDNDFEKICDSLVKLKHSIEEYMRYLKFKPIVDEIISIYKEKDKYKNSYTQLRKNIDKDDNKIIKMNFGIFSKNALPKQTEIALQNKELYKEMAKEKVYQTIATKLTEQSTYYDAINLASSFYEYLFTHLINKDKTMNDESIVDYIDSLQEFVRWPYFTILNNIKVLEEKDIEFLIKDRYNLLGINLTKDDLEEGKLPKLVETLEKVEKFYYIQKNGIDVDSIEDELELKTVVDSKK